MKSRLDIENSLKVIATAFLPLRCIPEERDYGQRIRFRVLDGDMPALRPVELSKAQFSNPGRLKDILGRVRSLLINQGYALNPWEFSGSVA